MKSEYFLLGFILVIIIIATIKKTNVFNAFGTGIKEGTTNVINMFSYIFLFILMLSLIESCGIIKDLEKLVLFKGFSPVIIIQILMRPFSGSSSLTMMMNIYETYGPDSFAGLFATFIHTITDSTIYIVSFYFTVVGIKRYSKVISIGLIINIIGFVLSFIIVYYLLI